MSLLSTKHDHSYHPPPMRGPDPQVKTTPTMGRRPRIALRAEAPKAHINPHSTHWHNVYPPEYLESKDFSPGFGIVAETFLHCEGHRLFLSHLFRREEQSQTNNNNHNNTTTTQTTTKTTNKHKTIKTTQTHHKQQT